MTPQTPTIQQIEQCVNLYGSLEENTYKFLPWNYKRFVSTLQEVRSKGNYLKVLQQDGQVLAFLYGILVDHHPHMTERVAQQQYFFTSRKGLGAYRAVKVLHEDFVRWAEGKKCAIVLSTGSHMDEDYTFTKLLERCGWERRGYLAVWKTKWYV